MEIRNDSGELINHFELDEQYLAKHFVNKNDIVLELGARFGAVSCTVNDILVNKNNHIVVEPDERVWQALEMNKKFNNCHFNIVKGFISSKKMSLTNLDSHQGYATTSIEDNNSKIPSYTLDEIQKQYNLLFNVLIADCEGFLGVFFEDNPKFYDQIRLVIFEADNPEMCDYEKIRTTLQGKGFRGAVGGFQNVWLKE